MPPHSACLTAAPHQWIINGTWSGNVPLSRVPQDTLHDIISPYWYTPLWYLWGTFICHNCPYHTSFSPSPVENTNMNLHQKVFLYLGPQETRVLGSTQCSRDSMPIASPSLPESLWRLCFLILWCRAHCPLFPNIKFLFSLVIS